MDVPAGRRFCVLELGRSGPARFEREGNDLAARGDLAAAAERYQQAIALDAQRTHSHAGRGMALASHGRLAEAAATNARAAALAAEQGDTDLAVQIAARGRVYRRTGQNN